MCDLKKALVCVSSLAVFLLVMAALGQGQIRVDNPAQPTAKNAGRIVKLEEVLRIKDDGVTAVFRLPRKLALGADGSLFFHDFAEGDRLYRYSPEGKLRYKILKTGQGPGESQHVSNFFLEGDRIRVQAWTPPKIMDFGLDGRYLSEIPTESTHGLHSLFMAGGKIYGLRDEIPHSQAIFKTGLIETPYSLYEISPDFKTWRKLQDFPVRHSIKNHSWVRLDMIDAAAGGLFVYVVHAAEYRIDQFGLVSGKLERIITRAYERQRIMSKKQAVEEPETQGVQMPSFAFMFDISQIHTVKDRLWIFTSTERAGGNERLVDVFDAEGRFVDSFYLQFPDAGRNHRISKSLITDEGILFIPEEEEDGLISIGKYRILDAGLFPASSAAGDVRAARRGQ
jgi:hypothetical protein